MRADRTISSGKIKSMCSAEFSLPVADDASGCERGNDWRNEIAKRRFSESRILTAKAIVSYGNAARVSNACITLTELSVRDTEVGMRFER